MALWALYVPPFGLHIFSGHAQWHSSWGSGGPAMIRSRGSKSSAWRQTIPIWQMRQTAWAEKSTTDGSLMIDDAWFYSRTQWHSMTIVTIVDGFLSKSKASKLCHYMLLGKQLRVATFNGSATVQVGPSYYKSQGLHETRPSECPGLGKCRQWVYDRTWHAKKALVERAEIFENSRGFWLQTDTSEINTADNGSNIIVWISINI